MARSLDGRIASLLLVGGALNGLVYRLVLIGKEQGSDATLEFFGISPFELLVIAVAARLSWRPTPMRLDLCGMAGAGLYMALMLWPSSLISWLLTMALAAALSFRLRGAMRSGALLFLALAVWEIWNAVLEPMAAKPLLALDAGAVSRLLSVVRDRVAWDGNIVGDAEGHRIVILTSCSTAHFAPLALLGAAAMALARGERLGVPGALALAALASVLVALNLARLTLMAWSEEFYAFVHGFWGAMTFDALTSFLVVAVALTLPHRDGARRAP